MTKAPRSKPEGTRTILWWVLWITFTIVSFFIASWFWTPIIYSWFGSVRETRASIAWVIAVFGTWLIFLVPLIVIMYQKVDKAYEDARIRREKTALRFRSIDVPLEKRKIPSSSTALLQNTAETIEGGFLVRLTLRDGRLIPYAFVNKASEILGIYDEREMSFEGKDVVSVVPADNAQWPSFTTQQWLRVDGVQPSE